MIRSLVLYALLLAPAAVDAVAAAPAAPPATPATRPAGATAEQRQFVADQLAKLKVSLLDDEAPAPDPKAVLAALVGRGKDILPAVREALPRQDGAAREVCTRAVTLLSWGFDPEVAVSRGLVKVLNGAPLPAGAVPKPVAEAAIARALPTFGVYELTFGPDPQSARPVEPLALHNYVLLARDASVTVLSSPKAIEAFFKAARQPSTNPAKLAGPAVDEQAVRDVQMAWLTMAARTASDAQTTFRPAPETFAVKRNGVRWVATGRYIPTGDGAAKLGQRQLVLVLGPDGSVVTAAETAGLKPLKK